MGPDPGRQGYPSWIVSHHLALDDAPNAHKCFDAREDGWAKVILHPHGH